MSHHLSGSLVAHRHTHLTWRKTHVFSNCYCNDLYTINSAFRWSCPSVLVTADQISASAWALQHPYNLADSMTTYEVKLWRSQLVVLMLVEWYTCSFLPITVFTLDRCVHIWSSCCKSIEKFSFVITKQFISFVFHFSPSWFNLVLKSTPAVALLSSSPISGCLVVYERRWRTAGARPAQNTTEMIQFGVGSKLFGHLRTAWCGDEHRAGWMHISAWLSCWQGTETAKEGCQAERLRTGSWHPLSLHL